MKIIGVRSSSFDGTDGKKVHGVNVFLSAPITKYGYGVETIRIFLIDDKMSESLAIVGGDMADLVGVDCEPVYNRYGKVVRLDFPAER